MIRRFLEWIGRGVLRLLEDLGRFFQMLASTVVWTPRPPYDVAEVLRQMVRVGVNYKLPWSILDSFFRR